MDIDAEALDLARSGLYAASAVEPIAAERRERFFIRRDGSVTGFRFITSSGNFAFDLEAQGAVEAAAARFGPLPADFSDDILPVTFSFDPARLR